MEALLGQWDVQVLKSRDTAEATRICAQTDIDAILADYHLGDGIDGIRLLQRLSEHLAPPFCAALISADHGAEATLAARMAGFPLLHKPLRPAALRALLSAFRRMRGTARAADAAL